MQSAPVRAGLYRGTSLMRNRTPIRLYSSSMPRALCWSYGGGAFSYVRGTPVCNTVGRYGMQYGRAVRNGREIRNELVDA